MRRVLVPHPSPQLSLMNTEYISPSQAVGAGVGHVLYM